MKFVTKEDIGAPIDAVFSKVSDFHAFERSAIRRGAEVTRRDSPPVNGEGAAWDVRFDMRGKRRDIGLEVTEFDGPERMQLKLRSEGVKGHVLVDLVALSRSRTRIRIETEIKPKTLSARLLIQSLRLARGTIEKRLAERMAEFAAALEKPPSSHG
ncbi:Polyketide cyclase / dehydrase and lipid transport [Pseudooceanicola antarcticus]|uniref:Polyketide cyclase / dehydrase and lipid transport n=1 Tax=Pseudooceanicola antarcticus TaxID=1247613 RepID=A0A285I0J2_9RHOB|nr:SRPBCC family protein [Pseudooceanicola antarcticus]PJE30283.1 SRPBCC family protein [Pseudooceanicola antarcticus]SNY41393.1 Polyketide cyclase / dehydrase and lipid transport [Pseudooceanicola antarcticus]